MKITPNDHATRVADDAAKPDQFGNLHERMKYLVAALHAHEGGPREGTLWQAVYDLETEVKYHKPANPPYGRRAVSL